MQLDKNLLRQVRSGFVGQGISLSKFCEQQGLLRQSVYKALTFKRNGEKAKELRKRLIEAAMGNP